MANRKYSLEYIEGFLEGLGLDFVDKDGNKKTYRQILDQCFLSDIFAYGNCDKALDCICDPDFIHKYL